MHNSHSTQILALVVAVAWAIASAKGAKGRLRTLLVIVGLAVAGLGVGFVIGVRSENTAINLMILTAVMSAIVCILANRQSRQGRVQRK